MRKSHLTGAILLLVAGVAGFLAYRYAGSEAARAADQLIADLRATGAKVTHGAREVDVWSRSFRIDNLTVASPSDPAGTLRIGRLAAAGIDPLSGSFAAKQMEATDVAYSTSIDIGDTVLKVTASAPLAVFDEFGVASPKEPAASDAVLRAVHQFALLKAKTLTAPSISVGVELPSPAGAPGTVGPVSLGYAYDDLKLEGLDDGRIGHMHVGKFSIKGGSSALEIADAEMNGFDVSDIDLLPMFGIGLERRTADNGYYRVQGPMKGGRYRAATSDGSVVELAGSTADGMWLDPKLISYQQLTAMLSSLKSVGPNADTTQVASMLGAVSRIYEGLRWDGIDMSGFTVTNPKQGSDIRLGRLRLATLSRGKLDQVRLEDLNVGLPPASGVSASVKLGAFALKGLDLASFYRVLAEGALAAPDRPLQPDIMWTFLSGVSMNGLSVEQGSDRLASVDTFDAHWGDFVEGVPTSVRLRFKGNIPVASNPGLMFLAAQGINRADLDVDLAASYDKTGQTITVKPLTFGMKSVGAISGVLTFANVDLAKLRVAPNEFAGTLALKGIHLEIKDDGLVTLLNAAAPDTAISAADPLEIEGGKSPSALEQLRAQQDPMRERPGFQALIDSLTRFTTTPGQALKIDADPEPPVGLAEFMGAMSVPGGLAGATESIGLRAVAGP